MASMTASWHHVGSGGIRSSRAATRVSSSQAADFGGRNSMEGSCLTGWRLSPISARIDGGMPLFEVHVERLRLGCGQRVITCPLPAGKLTTRPTACSFGIRRPLSSNAPALTCRGPICLPLRLLAQSLCFDLPMDLPDCHSARSIAKINTDRADATWPKTDCDQTAFRVPIGLHVDPNQAAEAVT
jgi:hypothetical protein